MRDRNTWLIGWRHVLLWLAAGLGCLPGLNAVAQTPPAPGAAEILQTLPQSSPKLDSGIKLEDKFTGKAVADVEGMRIEVKAFRVVGLTTISEAELTEALAPFLGADKRFQDLLDAAAAVKRELAGRGYFLADVIIP